MTLSECASLLEGSLKGDSCEFNGASIDTRTLKKGNLYFAIIGENLDGHDFIQAAEKAGAAAAIVSRKIETSLPLIIVKDTIQAFGLFAKNHWQRYARPCIAVTGSCGKTTTRHLITHILQQAGEVLFPKKNLNNHIGVPMTLLEAKAEHDYAVFELGANHCGEIQYLTNLVHPNVAVLTNAEPVHLEKFGSLENIIRTKGEIFEGLSETGFAILNADSPHYLTWQESIGDRAHLSFGEHNPISDVRAENIVFNEEGYPTFTLITPYGNRTISLPLLGQHNVMNALAAVAATLALGLDLDAAKAGLELSTPYQNRMVSQRSAEGALIYNDSYNANPTAFRAVLDVLQRVRGNKKIVVMGDMGELGADAKEFHTEIGELARDLGINALYAYGDLSRHAAIAFGKGAYHYEDKSRLIDDLKQNLDAETVVLVKGSRSMKMEEVVEAIAEASTV